MRRRSVTGCMVLPISSVLAMSSKKIARPRPAVVSWPRRGVRAMPVTAATIPCMPPFFDRMPIMPPIIMVNRMILMRSASAMAATRWVSNEAMKPRHSPPRDSPAASHAPHHMPTNRAGSTDRKISAKAMATNGGTTDAQPGMTDTSTAASTAPSADTSTSRRGPLSARRMSR